MNDNTHDNKKGEKLLQDKQPFSYGTTPRKKSCNNKKITRVADPHIEGRKVKGKTYYYYRRGTDAPEYLGTADTILRSVKLAKLATGK